MTVTVITGAASGMGRLCVERLRDSTERLVAVDLKDPEIRGSYRESGVTSQIRPPSPNSPARCRNSVRPVRSFTRQGFRPPWLMRGGSTRWTSWVPRCCSTLSSRWSHRAQLPCAFFQLRLSGGPARIDGELQAFVSNRRVPGYLDASG